MTGAVGNYETRSPSRSSRGYIDLQQIPVTWHGSTAVYSLAETDELQGLLTREAWIIHSLKSLCGGELTATPSNLPVEATESLPNGTGLVAAPEQPTGTEMLVFTDPDDIEFGEEKNPTAKPKRRIYAVVWTPGNHRGCKYKGSQKRKRQSAEYVMAIWKKWHERRGFRVDGRQGESYRAYEPGSQIATRAIVLHEYDAETRERL